MENIMVRTVDTDVINVVCQYGQSSRSGLPMYCFRLWCNIPVYRCYCYSGCTRQDKSVEFMFHAFKGCNVTSSFMGKGTDWSAWNAFDNLTTAFCRVVDTVLNQL